MRFCIVLMILLASCFSVFSQENGDFFSLSEKKQKQFLNAVDSKYKSLEEKITSKTKKTIANLKKQEYKIYKKLYKKDSLAAKEFLGNSQTKYAEIESKLNNPSNTTKQLKEYLPAFDTIKSSLSFLDKNFPVGSSISTHLGRTQNSVKQFESRMQIVNEIKKQLKDRKQQLAQQLEQFGLVKDLKKVNKEMFYYQEQLKEYKALLKDPKKIELKAIAALRNSKGFKEFMKKNSMLAQLFKVPENYGTPESLAGLQTTQGVAALLQQRFAGTGTNPREYLTQQVSQAQAEMSKLKGKLNKIGSGSSSDIDMPENFKPNTQKTKSFLSRLEYGANFQTQRPNGLLPVTSDLAITLGYKLNDKSVIGIGASYKLGWGKGIANIKLTSEGAGLRSFIDYKLKGSVWITGGYEQNYYQAFRRLQQISNIDLWKQSALLGLTKKIKAKKDKTSKVQLLYDFFYQSNNIRTQPLMFRIEYGF